MHHYNTRQTKTTTVTDKTADNKVPTQTEPTILQWSAQHSYKYHITVTAHTFLGANLRVWA